MIKKKKKRKLLRNLLEGKSMNHERLIVMLSIKKMKNAYKKMKRQITAWEIIFVSIYLIKSLNLEYTKNFYNSMKK